MNGFEPRLIETAALVNSQMPEFTVSRVASALNQRKKSIKGSRLLALGIAYKRDVSDTRESPALQVARTLMEKGATVTYSDPYVPMVAIGEETLVSVPLTAQLIQSMDCVVILTDHPAVDYSMIATHSAVVVDCRNALKNFSGVNVIPL